MGRKQYPTLPRPIYIPTHMIDHMDILYIFNHDEYLFIHFQCHKFSKDLQEFYPPIPGTRRYLSNQKDAPRREMGEWLSPLSLSAQIRQCPNIPIL